MQKLRPIDADVHLKYICSVCQYELWVSLAQASTPSFLLVCDSCNTAHKLDRISKFKIIYDNKDIIEFLTSNGITAAKQKVESLQEKNIFNKKEIIKRILADEI